MDVEQQDHQDIDPSWINEAYLIDRQRLFISQFKNAYVYHALFILRLYTFFFASVKIGHHKIYVVNCN